LVDGKYLVLLAAPPDGRRPRTVGPDHSASAPAATTQRDYSGHISTNGSARPDSDLINLDALLADYRRLAEQAGKADALRQQIDSLEEQNRETREALVALANRNGWLESRLEEREHELKLLTDSRHRVSWWRRLFGATPGRETA
jgi:hypothetical protein